MRGKRDMNAGVERWRSLIEDGDGLVAQGPSRVPGRLAGGQALHNVSQLVQHCPVLVNVH